LRHFIGLKDEDITTLAIGGFDGMHTAHQKLFSYLSRGGAVLVIDNGYANITPKTYREKFTKYPIYYENLKDIKNLAGDEFINKLKNRFIKLDKIVVGYDFRFGAGAVCGIKELKENFKKVVVVEEITYDNIPIHSQTIRQYITTGEISRANDMLGRAYEIRGSVISGQGVGAKKLVPTINISSVDFLLPKDGVYKTTTIIDDQELASITFVGTRATTDGNFSIETHIIEQNISNISADITIKFISYMRANKKFDTLDELKSQIQLDIKSSQA